MTQQQATVAVHTAWSTSVVIFLALLVLWHVRVVANDNETLTKLVLAGATPIEAKCAVNRGTYTECTVTAALNPKVVK